MRLDEYIRQQQQKLLLVLILCVYNKKKRNKKKKDLLSTLTLLFVRFVCVGARERDREREGVSKSDFFPPCGDLLLCVE